MAESSGDPCLARLQNIPGLQQCAANQSPSRQCARTQARGAPPPPVRLCSAAMVEGTRSERRTEIIDRSRIVDQLIPDSACRKRRSTPVSVARVHRAPCFWTGAVEHVYACITFAIMRGAPPPPDRRGRIEQRGSTRDGGLRRSLPFSTPGPFFFDPQVPLPVEPLNFSTSVRGLRRIPRGVISIHDYARILFNC